MSKKFLNTLLAIALSSHTLVFAQYAWIDEKGNKQYSDRPPPASVPANKIIKGGSKSPAKAESTTAANEEASEKPKTWAEKNADYNKRQKEAGEKQQKAEAEKQTASDKASNCSKAQNAKAALESGQRIGQFDKNGERSILDDQQRSKALEDANKIIAENCK